MVAAEIGEGGCRDFHPVEAELVEAVGGGLHRQMIDAGIGQPREAPMEIDRIQRGEGEIFAAAGCDEAQRAQARGPPAEQLPDLAREFGGGGLAAGAGDRGDDARLAGEEAGRHQGQAAARVLIGDKRDAGRQLGAGGRQHGDGALGGGLGDEAAAVGLAPRQGSEEEAGLDLARIGGESADLDLALAP